jgi:hypothetical protein
MLLLLIGDDMAEWLRRGPAKAVGVSRAGSIPAVVDMVSYSKIKIFYMQKN